MGLPLYVAPVESDVPGKAITKSPAHARSTIRRRVRRNSEAARENRRRALAAAGVQTAPDSWLLRSRSTSNEPNAAPSTSHPASNTTATAGSNRARDSLRELIGGDRPGDRLDDRVAAVFGERWADLHARSNPSPLRDDDVPLFSQEGNALTVNFGNPPNIAPSGDQRRRALINEAAERRLSSRLHRSPPPLRRVSPRDFYDITDPYAPRSRRVLRRANLTVSSQVTGNTRRPREARFDGLGDRDRSLSPEGDGVWDTLLSTLTPDPQPPSVGSSFASASASAVASQSTAAGSSSTSLTGPETADESAFEQPCESGCENSDTEGDEDDMDMVQMGLTRFPSSLRHSRSYADVAAHSMQNSSSEDMELFGDIGSMQRIVRNLARREDIPDEWWAEAGLSRTLSREASN